MRFYFDTEFSASGFTVNPISYGMVSESGQELHLVNRDVDWATVSPWVLEHVRPHLASVPGQDVLPLSGIGARLRAFVAEHSADGKVEFWAYNAPHDWIALTGLFGTLDDRPQGWPKDVRDIKEMCRQLGNPNLPAQTVGHHDALADARWARDCHQWLLQYRREREVAREAVLRRRHLQEAAALLKAAANAD